MFAWMNKIVGSVAAVAVLSAAPALMASTVTYTTVGSFFAVPATDTVTTNAAGSVLSVPGDLQMKLSFFNVITPGTESSALPAFSQVLGKFNLSFVQPIPPNDTTQSFALTDTFSLTLTQTDPGNATGIPATATISGTITYSLNDDPTGNASVKIKFNNPLNNPIVLVTAGNAFSYKLKNNTILVGADVTPGGVSVDSSLLADISAVPLPGGGPGPAVPLPKTASLGLAMFGALGLAGAAKSVRRFRVRSNV